MTKTRKNLKLLVIDDAVWNQTSARLTLERDHRVTVVGDVGDAYDLLCRQPSRHPLPFDGILTDLHMPVGRFEGQMYAPSKFQRGQIKREADFPPPGFLERAAEAASKPIPAGLVFALAAAAAGVPVAICSDSDHHRDWICALLDLINMMSGHHHPSTTRGIAYVEARSAYVRGRWEEATGNILPIGKEGWAPDEDWSALRQAMHLKDMPKLSPQEYEENLWGLQGKSFIKNWQRVLDEAYLWNEPEDAQ